MTPDLTHDHLAGAAPGHHPHAASQHERIVARLYERWPEHRIAPSLSRVQALCDLLGSPERAMPVIMVTGTNGKGSTAIIIDALLRAAGLRTGRFASPHLSDVRERINIDGHPISAERFDELYQQVEPMVQLVDAQQLDGVAMTAFEVFTGLAYAAFADAPVDVAVVEVGMGGTWDATNVADAQVAVICPIDLDHTHILGDTVEQIAGEKAGIIKPGATAVMAAQQPDAARVLLERCQQVGARPVLEGRDFGVVTREPNAGGQVLRLDTAAGAIGDLFLPLFGAAMAQNAAVAVAAVEAFLGGKALDATVIEQGFQVVRAPARLEVVRTSPTVIVDTAHNPQAARAAVDALAENFGLNPLIGVVSIMRDKDYDEVLEILSEAVSELIVTRVQSTDRGLPVDELLDVAQGIFGTGNVRSADSYAEALDEAMRLADEAGPGAGVLVAGSVIGAGEARDLLVDATVDAQTADTFGDVDDWDDEAAFAEALDAALSSDDDAGTRDHSTPDHSTSDEWDD